MLFTNIWKYASATAIITLLVICILLYLNVKELKQNIKQVETQLYSKQAVLEFQSREIERQKLDIQNYKSQKPIIKEKIITKYKDKIIYDETCESKLKAYEDLLKIFNNEK